MCPPSQVELAHCQADGRCRFGLGAIVPKDVQYGTFTNRVPTSHEKLLENLIGKKAAKAHLATKQKHAAPVKPQKPVKPMSTKEESDEEEGRASTFKSKRRRRAQPNLVKHNESGDEDDESKPSSVERSQPQVTEQSTNPVERDVSLAHGPADQSDEATLAEDQKRPPVSQPAKVKPTSYLDELLGEKAKKKKKKKKGKKKGTNVQNG